MKTFIAIVKLIGGVVALLSFIGFFLPAEVKIEESIRVEASPAHCFYMLQDLQEWKNWSGIVPGSSESIQVKVAPDGSRNWITWQSGPGSLNRGFVRIHQSIPHGQIHMSFQAGNLGPAKSSFLMRPYEGGTEINWTFETNPGHNPYTKLRALIWERHVHRIFSAALSRFAAKVKTYKPPLYLARFSWGEIPAGNRVFIQRYGISSLDFKTELQKTLGEVQLVLAQRGLSCTSPPYVIVENPASLRQDFQAGFYVGKAVMSPLPLPLQVREVKAQPALVCHFQGSPTLSFLMESEMRTRLQSEKKTPTGNSMEFLITDPGSAQVPLDIKTEIFLPYQSTP